MFGLLCDIIMSTREHIPGSSDCLSIGGGDGGVAATTIAIIKARKKKE